MPEIQCADLKQAYKKRKMVSIFTRLLLENIQATLKANKQLFYFKIGGYAQEKCVVCSWTPTCKSAM